MLKLAGEDDRTVSLNFRMLEFLLRFIAVWPTDYSAYLLRLLTGRYSFVSQLMNALYQLFWFSICLHIAAFHIVTILTDDLNYDELFLILITASIYSIMVPLSVYLRWYESRVRHLYEYANRLFRKRSATGMYYLSISTGYRFANRCLFWWIVFCGLGTMHWAIYPILSRERTLPFPCWYPVDVQQSPMYELAYTFQVFGQLQVGLTFGLAGALFMLLVFVLSRQFDMLRCSLINVRHTAKILHGGYRSALCSCQDMVEVDTSEYFLQEAFREDLAAVEMGSSGVFKQDHLPASKIYLMELSQELSGVLEDCIRHHLVLLKFCRLLEDCYHPYILLKLFQILLLLCFLAVMATVESLSAMKLINVLEYFTITMTELYLFCFLGQILTNQGLKVGDALCKSPWHLCGASYRQRMLIMLMNAQQPVRLTGLKLYELNLQTYYTVLKAAFSFYTIIKKFR